MCFFYNFYSNLIFRHITSIFTNKNKMSSIVTIDESKLDDYRILAKDYCLVNGLLLF